MALYNRLTLGPWRIVLTLACTVLLASPLAKGAEVEPGLMAELQRVYQTEDDDDVIERLAAEAEAMRVHDIARDLLGDTYAGAWFDVDNLRLAVGSTESTYDDLLARLGASPIRFERSHSELLELLEQVSEETELRRSWSEAVTSIRIDFPANQVVVSVRSGYEESVQSLPAVRQNTAAIRIERSPGGSVPVASLVRGADKYNNDDRSQQYGYIADCSIGFSVEGGYLTAGHCGYQGDQVLGFNGNLQGSFDQSQTGNGHDRAWVSVNSNWIPSAWINGYQDGLMGVPAKWAGLQEAPLNATVCRYGQASDGPHCGQITATNVDERLKDPVTGSGTRSPASSAPVHVSSRVTPAGHLFHLQRPWPRELPFLL